MGMKQGSALGETQVRKGAEGAEVKHRPTPYPPFREGRVRVGSALGETQVRGKVGMVPTSRKRAGLPAGLPEGLGRGHRGASRAPEYDA
jgi:hypothetical protein